MVINHPIYNPLYTNNDKFICLITGGRGCEHPDTPIMMADLTIKKIKDIEVGESVMGDDGSPRKVLEKCHGFSQMYKVHQSDAEDYIVNDSHILTLRKRGKTYDVPIQSLKKGYKGLKVIDIRAKKLTYLETDIKIEPQGFGEYYGFILDGNHRYLHADGTVTHNSGKSFSASTFIERLTFEIGQANGKKVAHQILYSRYTMTSAEISVIPEFMEKVEADGTGKYFTTTKKDVINLMTGSHVMFRGLKTSSGNQTAKLKSIKGLTVFVCDEGEEWVSEKEFETIMFSIRQLGIRNLIIIIMNPTDSNHFIYQKYIKDTHKLVEYDGVPVQISTHPNVLHIHTSYLDNIQYLSEQFIREAEEMKRTNPERYAHIFMGRWADVREGAVFKNWGVVDEFPSQCKHVARGLDFGYITDPSACVKCGVWNNCLYIDEQFYAPGMLSSDLIRELKKEKGMVYADSADPRLIDEIGNAGIVIYPVSKGGGSIIAGIDKIQTFDHVFYTKRSINLQDEYRNYVWAKDKDGNYINEPEDHDNHCLTGDTLITTDKGERRMDRIRVGDMVMTSDGLREVENVFDNGEKQIWITRIRFGEDEVILKATPEHRIKTTQGWKEIRNLSEGDALYHNGQIREITQLKVLDRRWAFVYDLQVQDMHEYYANGILVHNCMDATRYYILGHILGKVIKRSDVNKSDLGIY